MAAMATPASLHTPLIRHIEFVSPRRWMCHRLELIDQFENPWIAHPINDCHPLALVHD